MIKRSASNSRVTFVLPFDQLDQPVSVVGDFNDWDPLAHPLRKRSNRTRSVSVDLEPGTYRFKYLAHDGSWLTEADAESVTNDHAGIDSLLTV